MMTLQDWCQIYDKSSFTVAARLGVYSPAGTPGYIDLWQLEDFAVEAVHGPVVWLRPQPVVRQDPDYSYAWVEMPGTQFINGR